MNRKSYILIGAVVIIIVLGLFFVLTDTKSVTEVNNPAAADLGAEISTSTAPSVSTTSTSTGSNASATTSLNASSTSTSTTTAGTASSTATNPDASSTTLSVSFTGTSFSPNALTIQHGQTVTFTNNSTSSMWVASDPYPSDSNYPEFNESQGVLHGGVYSFTFDRIGSFSFHDELSPQIKGLIVSE
jgi:plastocyanin